MQRKYLRGPLGGSILYVNEGFVLQGQALNIGEGGLYLRYLPRSSVKDTVSLMISLPLFPPLDKFLLGEGSIVPGHLPTSVLRGQGNIVRKVENQSVVDEIFTTNVALNFIKLERGGQKKIARYVESVRRNICYLLGMFENEIAEDTIRRGAEFLAYPSALGFNTLRAKILHDYQSLKE